MSFQFSDLDPKLGRALDRLGFERPTPIQQSAIPHGRQGRDVLACAMTGSGKTAAFLIPVIERLLDKPRGTTRALVLSPTRELASQTVDAFNDLARFTKLRAAAVYGGVGMGPQVQAFRRGVDVLVACPGRLLDHFQYPYAKLDGLEVLVLDEADRMLDMGFLPDIRRILRHLPPVDQRLLFSATMPPAIAELSKSLLENPARIDVERPSAPAKKVRQTVFSIGHAQKPALLLELLRRDEIDNALIFTRTKHRADRLARSLGKLGVACDRIHGNRSQAQRTRALDAFKRGRTRVLVATDIAARGIDVDSLSHVVNFDVPNLAEDYIHRVGRTARADKSGEAFTFVAPQENAYLRTIERAVGRLPRRQLDGFDPEAPIAGLWSPRSGGTERQQQAPARTERPARPKRPAKPRRKRPQAARAQGRPQAESDRERAAAPKRGRRPNRAKPGAASNRPNDQRPKADERPKSARGQQTGTSRPAKKRRRRGPKNPKTTAFATFERDNDLSRPRRRRAARVAYT